jgi:hypothetical protein
MLIQDDSAKNSESRLTNVNASIIPNAVHLEIIIIKINSKYIIGL